MNKKCIGCNKSKNKKFFNKNKNNKDGLQNYCKVCKKTADYKNIEKRKITWDKNNILKIKRKNILLNNLRVQRGGCCKKCEENKLHVLDFHHIDSSLKEESIGNMLNSMGIDNLKIQKEIDKCILLCSNCHRDFHFLERETQITIEEYLKMPL